MSTVSIKMVQWELSREELTALRLSRVRGVSACARRPKSVALRRNEGFHKGHKEIRNDTSPPPQRVAV